MPLDRNATRAVSATFAAIRRSITAARKEVRFDQEEDRTLTGAMLQIEGMRSRMMFIGPSSSPQSNSSIQRAIVELIQGLDIVISNQLFMELSSKIIYHNPSTYSAREEIEPFLALISKDARYVSEIIANLRAYIEANDEQPKTIRSTSDVGTIVELGRAVPAQKVGPVQLTVRDGKLAIASQSASPRQIDSQNVDRARADILERGAILIKELKSSNNDPRLIAEIERMNSKVQDSKNIIEIGVSNIGCGLMGSAFREEMSPAVSSMLSTYTLSVDMYVAQFPDWNRFVEQAALSQIEQEDIIQIREAAQSAVDRLMARPDIVEAEVPETFKKLIRLIENPAQAGKRAAFAVLRSIENLISKAVSYAGELADKTVHKSIDKLSGTLSAALVAGLLTIAVDASTGVGPIAAKISELHWLKNAIEVVQEHLSKIKTGKDKMM
ncbi:hypothetical protein FHR71_000914 [Methylobacterium sp. RAS18]|nr:hypothetical protein [Methylobacterium sp. RAS18]